MNMYYRHAVTTGGLDVIAGMDGIPPKDLNLCASFAFPCPRGASLYCATMDSTNGFGACAFLQNTLHTCICLCIDLDKNKMYKQF